MLSWLVPREGLESLGKVQSLDISADWSHRLHRIVDESRQEPLEPGFARALSGETMSGSLDFECIPILLAMAEPV